MNPLFYLKKCSTYIILFNMHICKWRIIEPLLFCCSSSEEHHQESGARDSTRAELVRFTETLSLPEGGGDPTGGEARAAQQAASVNAAQQVRGRVNAIGGTLQFIFNYAFNMYLMCI